LFDFHSSFVWRAAFANGFTNSPHITCSSFVPQMFIGANFMIRRSPHGSGRIKKLYRALSKMKKVVKWEVREMENGGNRGKLGEGKFRKNAS